MLAIVALAIFLTLAAVFSAVRTPRTARKLSVSDIDRATAKTPRPGARDRFAMNGATLTHAPVPSWG